MICPTLRLFSARLAKKVEHTARFSLRGCGDGAWRKGCSFKSLGTNLPSPSDSCRQTAVSWSEVTARWAWHNWLWNFWNVGEFWRNREWFCVWIKKEKSQITWSILPGKSANVWWFIFSNFPCWNHFWSDWNEMNKDIFNLSELNYVEKNNQNS